MNNTERTDTERLEWLATRGSIMGGGLISDDKGHWVFTADGIQTICDGDGPDDCSTAFFVEKGKWKNSVREAIDAAIHEDELELYDDMLARLTEIVRSEQDDPEKGPPTIRRLAKLLRTTQKKVHQMCEDNELNINIGLQNSNGYMVHDRIGDYTIEDLTVSLG